MMIVLMLLSFIVENVSLSDTKRQFLTANSSKAWALNTSDTACADVSSDNTYTFFADGTFRFDHGSVVEDPECSDNDLVNISGEWKLLKGDKILRIIGSHQTDKANNSMETVLMEGSIELLNEDVLRISQVTEGSESYQTIEFHSKR